MHSSLKAARPPAHVRLGAGVQYPIEGEVSGEHVIIDAEPYICIRNVDALKPFFMSIVSDGDLWIFAGSNSPFTAGRSNPDQAIFPYQTVDKVLRDPASAGATTVMLVQRGGGEWALWEPWRASGRLYAITRNLYKHANGSAVIFEETNDHLGLRLRWSLTASDAFGLVRECELENVADDAVSVRYLDGWHHLLPAGVTQDIYARFSYLAAAYMRHERADQSMLGIYTLNSRLSDRAAPVESLRATCAWSLGHKNPTVLLSARQVEAFRHNEPVQAENEVRGEFGAYLVADRVALAPGKKHTWMTIADTGVDHCGLVALERGLKKPGKLEIALRKSAAANRRGLRARIAAADGLQETADRSASVHHFANVLFNCMRGGTFVDSYYFPGSDFGKFLKSRNSTLHESHRAWLELLPERMTLEELDRSVAEQDDDQLTRLSREYLPLSFSRRHGDPSRPWNRFVIRVKSEHDDVVYDYQGNWRDIFQNWESLAHSYPAALERMIAVFLNASTADGYNPYRVTRGGIDWEVHDHNDPWSHIGYWGDHQIIYLLRLLQTCENHYPGKLTAQLGEKLYAYATVPYEIRGYDEIERDPGESIRFNEDLHKKLLERAEKIGNDGKLLSGGKGKIALISLAEKLLVPLLAKLSNLVPGGGIWMNTQRPDWNDANNALVGWGLSMVTVYQMRKYIQFVDALFTAGKVDAYEISRPVAVFTAEIATILVHAAKQPTHSAAERYSLVEALGRAGETYRASVYDRKVHESATLPVVTIHRLLENALAVVDDTIRANRREDGMYHSYNLLEIVEHTASVKRLQLMLEGQVGVLSCGLLTPEESIALLRAMAASELYRKDQDSYMLYPDKKIASFLSRNTLPKTWRTDAPLLGDLIEAGVRDIVVVDEEGAAHFQADLANAGDLNASLNKLAKDSHYRAAVARDRQAILHLWETVFDHSTFLGRSGTMFAFEGLGSIYWHMVAKYLLAVQENYEAALKSEVKPEVRRALAELYDDVRSGLGFTKTPQIYGAFPSDPYSHSPSHLGAQQPGMTGQVKEEILTRWGELGIEVSNGSIHFNPTLLRADEFYAFDHAFTYFRVDGEEVTWDLPAHSLAFTYCQVPICYHLSDTAAISIERKKGSATFEGSKLSAGDSASIFARNGMIVKIMVHIPRKNFIH
jgi:hypothetical protein